MKNRALIFICALVAPAFFANHVYAQSASHNSDPKSLSCDLTDPLKPIAGKPYDYSATFNPSGGTAFWYATTSTTFFDKGVRTEAIEAKKGDYVADADANYATDLTSSPASTKTNITWSSKGLADVIAGKNPLFVSVDYKNATGLCANNMKVYNIIPKNAFTVAIRSMSSSDIKSFVDYGKTTEQCAASVVGAVFDAASTTVKMDYGVQTLYFEVVAANFTGSYTPSFQISGLSEDATVGIQTAELSWGYNTTTFNAPVAIKNATLTGDNTVISADPVNTIETNTSVGVSIFVKVVITNHTFENTAQKDITLKVDAVNAQGQKDVKEDCTENGLFADAAVQTINPRPTITPGSGTFVPQAY